MRRVVLGAYSYLTFAIFLVAWLPILGAVALFARKNVRLRGQWMRHFGRTSARGIPLWRFRVEGKAPADIHHKPYVVVANHQSTADPWLLSSLRWDMRWIAKRSLFRAPVLGWLMRMGGDLPVERGEGASVRAMMAQARATLATGLPLMIFPEGTRSPDGQLQRFKDGAFDLAITAGVPILPVVVEGTHRCRPKGSKWFGDADATARVLAPIPTAGLTLADLPALREQVRDLIAGELASMQAAVASRARATAPVPAPAMVPTSDMALPAAVAAAVLTAASASARAVHGEQPVDGRPSADDAGDNSRT
jgi:1-acyl-sn-glycerol-3-phosphate acyltransferase